MKRLLTLAVLFLCCVATTFAQYSGSGNGTEDDPYLIYNETQLSQVSNFLNQEGVVFKLMKDLDLTEWISENNPRQGWLPIGVESMPFMGKFNGNNHKVSGLMIKRTSTDNVGFFGYVSGATIENLTIEGSSVTGASNVGGFIGYAIGSEITNCNLSLTSGVEGTSVVGGFIGQSYNSNFSTFNVEAAVKAQSYLGGFVGLAEGGNWQQGSVWGQCTCTGNYTGGFAGKMTDASLSDIKQNGNINGKDYTGGFVGCCSNDTFTRCKVKSNIQGAQYVSGFAGALENTTSSFNTLFHKGTITATGDYAGGIVGISKGGCIEKMESCSHFGDMNGKNYVGGLIGAVIRTIEPTLHTYTVYSWKHNQEPADILLQTTEETIFNGTSEIIHINNCTSIGNVVGTDWIGGIIGSDIPSAEYQSNAKKATCDNTYYYNKYLFKDGVYTGVSECGYSSLSYSHSYYKNTVSCSLTNNFYSGTIHGMNNVGGMCGYKSGGNIQNNYAYANIYGVSNVGGIVGQTSANSEGESYNTTTIKSNVAVVSAVSASNQNVGRIYGVVDTEHTSIGALGSSESNRALAQARVILSGVAQDIDDDLQNGTSIGPSALKLKGNYVSWGWNFDENWNILETESFPYKKYQAAPPIIESDLVSQATSISGKSFDGGTVYLYYKDRDAVSTECSNYKWNFNTEALQSGAIVQIYSDVEGLTPSYYTTATVGYPGSGTENDPWRIYTAEDLQGASNRGYYKVMNDIDLTQWINENSPEKGWIPIGRNSGDATYIDGNHRTISGLWIDNTENFNGLFSNFSTGQIKNLNVEVAEGKKVKGGDYTGILIGRNANGSLENCSVKGDVEGTIHVGGVVGYVENSTISSVIFKGNVASNTGDASIGGIAGQVQDCVVSGCRSESVVSVSGNDSRVGGLMGYSKNGSITNSITNTTLTATGTGNYVGGLVGYSETPITLSVSTGSVSATGGNSYSGGLVGYAFSPISNSYSTAITTGTQFTAGLVGYTFSTIDKCYAKGDVNGVMYGGGLVGELDGQGASLTNSVACNNILSLSAQSSWGSRVIGGFKNGAAEPNQSNYALNTMQVSLNNVPQTKTDDAVEGIAKTVEELNQQATYTALGWDFNDVWGIEDDYPYLGWNNPNRKPQSLAMEAIESKTYGDASFELPTTTDQGKPLTWTSCNNAVISINGNTATILKAGNTILTATNEGSNTYEAFSQDYSVDIAKATLKIGVGNYSKSIGEDNPEFTITYTGFVNDEDETVLTALPVATTTAEKDSPAGSYPITLSGAEAENYEIVYENGTLSVVDETMLRNRLYVENMSLRSGASKTIAIKLDNEKTLIACEFYMQLPEGFSIEEDEDGYPVADIEGARSNRHTLQVSNEGNGLYHFLCYSNNNNAFKGNTGDFITLPLVAAEDMEGDTYKAAIKNVIFSDENKKEVNLLDSDFDITVTNITPGDANGDDKINVMDIVETVSCIMGNPSANFVAAAVDFDENGVVNVMDLVELVDMIMKVANQAPAVVMATEDTPLSASTISTTQVGNDMIAVSLPDGSRQVAAQFMVTVPEGQRLEDVETDAAHRTTFTRLDDGRYMVMVYSLRNETFADNNAVQLKVSGGKVVVEDMLTVDADNTASVYGSSTQGDATGIMEVGAETFKPADIYSVSGLLIRKNATTTRGLAKGMYIINNKKITIQ